MAKVRTKVCFEDWDRYWSLWYVDDCLPRDATFHIGEFGIHELETSTLQVLDTQRIPYEILMEEDR